MKRLLLLTSLSFMFLFSCSDDSDSTPDELLNGKIDGIAFEMKTARYKVQTNGKLHFEIFNEGSSAIDVCGLIPGDIRVFFIAENTLEKQELFIDINTLEGFTVTLFNPDGANNIIAENGYVEIISINNDIIEAEMDVKVNNENFVKGRFEAVICQ